MDTSPHIPKTGWVWGIEHEFPVLHTEKGFCDFINTSYGDLDKVVCELPLFDSDYPQLRVGDLGIRKKRWYIEGLERFSDEGTFLHLVPKGMEIRTPICNSLREAIAVLNDALLFWERVAKPLGYITCRTSFNPFREEYTPTPALNAWERAQQTTPEDESDYIHMSTYGPDINFSHPELTVAQQIDIAQKLTYYSPFIVPFTFASPFYKGEVWGGLSRRTYYRTGRRPAVLTYVGSPNDLLESTPSLTAVARAPGEVGRIEFKAFDMVADTSLYEPLGLLLLGLALDTTLPGRALVPDKALHQRSAEKGFADRDIYEGTKAVFEAAYRALPEDQKDALAPLQKMLDSKEVPAHHMLETYASTGSILQAITSKI